MPNKDGTGPNGQGPLTGRGMGPCENRQSQGPGFGRGRCFRRFAQPINLSKQQEKKILQEQLNELEIEKQEIEKVLKELK